MAALDRRVCSDSSVIAAGSVCIYSTNYLTGESENEKPCKGSHFYDDYEETTVRVSHTAPGIIDSRIYVAPCSAVLQVFGTDCSGCRAIVDSASKATLGLRPLLIENWALSARLCRLLAFLRSQSTEGLSLSAQQTSAGQCIAVILSPLPRSCARLRLLCRC